MPRSKKNQEISLVKDESKKVKRTYIQIPCHILSDYIHDLAILKELLEKVGIEVSANHDTDANIDIIGFKINYETYNKTVYRGAGRKKDASMDTRYQPCTISELKKKLKTTKNADIIKELGCPKATFYRILKNIGNHRGIGDKSIWEFTSSSR